MEDEKLGKQPRRDRSVSVSSNEPDRASSKKRGSSMHVDEKAQGVGLEEGEEAEEGELDE